ncbi:MAG: glycine C-acetyltransferase, partial [Alphaproteobacteria bacterium]|nr:glycine C-acetyltransferase [Alphaproteobacteria bacterium]
MSRALVARLADKLAASRRAGTYKELRPLAGPVGGDADLADGSRIHLLCSNDYLGLSNHPAVRRGAHEA